LRGPSCFKRPSSLFSVYDIAYAGIIAQDGFKVQASAPTPEKRLRRPRL
jgi:hypothetical protein